MKTIVEKVTEKHKTPWLKQWTLHTVEIPEEKAEEVAEELSRSLESEHSWYADFKTSKMLFFAPHGFKPAVIKSIFDSEQYHYIIFRHKAFFIDRRSKEQYDEAKQYGISLGIPEYQVDFHPDALEWKR